MRTHRTTRLAAVGLAVVLGAAACGGGRSDSNDASGGSGGTTSGTGGSSGGYTIDTSECSDYQPTTGITDDTIKLGTSGPTSGTYGTAFAPIRAGYSAYFDYLNAEKGGVKGKKIEIVGLDKDDEYNPTKTKQIVDELVQQEEVFGLFNALGTANNLAIRDDLHEQCIPNLFVATGAVEWGMATEYPWVIGSLPSYATEAAVFAEYLKETKPDATVTILQQNDDFGNGYVNAFEQAIEGSDITVVKIEKFDAGVSDVASQMTSLSATGSDAFLMAGTALACANGMKAKAGMAEWTPITYVSVTCAISLLIELGGPASFTDSLTVAYLANPLNPEDAAALAEFNTKGAEYGLTPDQLKNSTVLYGWFVAEILAKTLEQAPELTRASVMETAYSLNLDLPIALPGVTVHTNGLEDPFPLENMYIAKFNGEFYVPEGDIIDFEGKTVDFLP